MTAKRVRRNSVWGGWQQFTDIDDVEVPDFLNAQVVDIPGSHDSRTTIGGAGCLESMFYGLVGPVEDKKATVLALRRAIVFFCEAFRLKSLLLEIFRRLVMNERPSRLPLQSWARIGSWKVLSYFLICWGKYGKRVQAELEGKLVSFSILYGLSSFEEVAAELLVLRYSDDFLLTNQVKKILSHKKAGMGIKDPKFPTF